MTLKETINECVESHGCIVCESADEYLILMEALEGLGFQWANGNPPTYYDILGIGGVPIGIFLSRHYRLTKSQDMEYIVAHHPIYYEDIGRHTQVSMYTFEEAFFGVKGE